MLDARRSPECPHWPIVHPVVRGCFPRGGVPQTRRAIHTRREPRQLPVPLQWRFGQRLLACQEDTLALAGREATGIPACLRLTLRVQPTKLRTRAKFACRPMDNDPKAGMRHGADPASFFAGRIACVPTASRHLGWSGSIAHIEESFAPETSCPDCTGRHRRGLPSPGPSPG